MKVNKGKPIIICVDDEKIVLESLREQLNREFQDEFEVEIVDNAEEALELFEYLRSDSDVALVISDQIMPGMKGDELLVKIHLISPKTLKILLTGQASAEAVGQAVNRANLYRYIAKPWDKGDLCLTVKEAIRRFQMDKSLEEKMIELQLKNERLETLIETLNKFVPHQFLDILNLNTEDYIQLGACSNRNISILFSDIRAFTTISEGKSSLEVFKFINDHYSIIGPIITSKSGFIDKYIGDAVMAIFTNANNAVKAGIEIQQRMNERDYQIGIGINTGEVIMGTVGEPGRLQTTVLGDSVNLAARVENLNKTYKTNMIITSETYLSLVNPEQFLIRKIDTLKVVGKSKPTTIFEVLDALPQEIKNKKLLNTELFNQALIAYQNEDWNKSLEFFERAKEICPEDGVIPLYISRINAMSKK